MNDIPFPHIYQEGVTYGLSAWNPDHRKIEINNPYPGSTSEGSSWYLGVIEGLRKASILHSLPV